MPLRALALALLVLAAGCGGGAGDGDADGSDTPREGVECHTEPADCPGPGRAPRRLSEHAAAYSPETLEMILFGGTTAIPVGCDFGSPAEFSDETYAFDDACGTWSRIETTGPSARGRHAAAFGDGAVWIFGGRFRDRGSTSGDYTLFDDLWRFDVAERTWSEVPTGGAPSPRVDAAFVWDSKRRRFWMHGGNASATGLAYAPLDDTWSFDPETTTWTEQATTGTPPPARLAHAALHDPVRDALVVFGGADENAFDTTARFFDDLWALQLETLEWLPLGTPDTERPDGRFWAKMVYDSTTDLYVLFAGHDDQALGNRNDVWSFDPGTQTWMQLGTGDTPNSPPGDGPCVFPADFTNVDLLAPERRSAHTLVWSEPCGHALAFGGKTDCGAADDVWQVDTGGWTERFAANEGEVCARRRDLATCTSMCE